MGEDSVTFWCESCGEGRPSDASFCQKCGAKVTVRAPEPEPTPEPEESALPADEVDTPSPPKRPSKKQLVIAASLVAALVLAGGTYGVISSIQQQREEQLAAEAAEKAAAEAAEAAAEKARLEAETLIEAFGRGQVESFLPSCEQVAGLTSAEEGKWEAAVAAFDGISDPREASRALDTVRSANGTLEDADVQAYFEGFQGGIAESLGALFDSSARDEQAPDSQIAKWEEQWLSLSREACPEEFDIFDSTYSSLQASAARFSRMSTLASQVPWYPEGYFELRSGIAYKWVDVPRDCYSCYQWDVDFIAQNGCSSVYAEVTISDSSGRVIGWANDSLRSVGPGAVGRLVFQEYGGRGTLTAKFTEFRCS